MSDDEDDWKPSTIKAKFKKAIKRSGGQKASTRKPRTSKKPRAPKRDRRKSADWDDENVVTTKQFETQYALGSQLTNAISDEYEYLIKKVYNLVIDERESCVNEERKDVADDNHDEEEEEEARESEEDDTRSKNKVECPSKLDEPYTPKVIRTVVDFETKPIDMMFFEPISKNVFGRDELQLSNCPLLSEDTKDLAICSGIFKAYKNGIHGYIDEMFESSQEIIFKVMTRILSRKDKELNPDYFYYTLYRIFPNTGSQTEFSELYPKLVRIFAKDEAEAEELLKLETWKTGKVKKEDKPFDYKHPLSRGNYFFKSLDLSSDNGCSEDCYKKMSKIEMESSMKRFQPNNNSLRLYVPKKCHGNDSSFLNALVLNDEEEMLIDFCAVAKKFNTKSCAEWAKHVLSMAKPSPIQDKANKTYKEKHHSFRSTMERDVSAALKEMEKKKEAGVDTDDERGSANKETDFESSLFKTVSFFKPCCHFGPCGPNVPECSCQHWCSVYCQCDDNCPRKFPGCQCQPNKCGQNSCPCKKIGWECIKETCKSCLQPSESIPQAWCKNNLMTIGKGKSVKHGDSNIAGTGAFLHEDVKADDFLGQYTGEYISEAETERRGKAYELGVNYILGLPWEQGSIDATRAGNVFRFVNHSNTPNCYIQVKIVHGKPCAGFYAKKAMKAGTELSFDYNYDPAHAFKYFECAPEDRVPKAKSRRKVARSPPVKQSRHQDSEDDDYDDPNKPSTSSSYVYYK